MALQKGNLFGIRKSSEKRVSAWKKCISAALTATAICSACLFAKSYNELNVSIQNERMTSITQLGTLISDKVLLLRKGYMDATRQLASTLMYSGAETLEDMGRLFEYDQDLMLITAGGSYMMMDGRRMLLNNVRLDGNLSDGKEVQSSFDTIYGLGDYWLFSIPIEGISIEGEEIIGLVNMVAARQYAEVAAVVLFDELGASYVVNQNGTILMRPAETEMNGIFSGYNLLNILSKEQVPAQSCSALENALLEGRENHFTATIRNEIWLVQSVPMEDGLSVVITVPVSMTAHATFEGMKDTILSIAIVILSLSALLLSWMLYFYRKNQKNELSQAKIKAKNDFLDKMSHDIRTPLNAIIGMHELALRSMDNREMVHDSLLKAKRSSQYLVSIINDVLDMSRIESGKMSISHSRFRMSELLEHVEQMETVPAREKNLVFSVQRKSVIDVDFIGDSVRIRQCLVNLISNSIKFTPEGGRVSLVYESRPLEDGRCLVRFTVSDTGIGMSREFLERIFNPFEQEESSLTSANIGSGLGLSIVNNLVSLMNGEITVDSQQGKGSVFTITIPFDTVPQEDTKEERYPDEELLKEIKGKRILLVEDNMINREIMCELLSMLGLIIVEAEDGRKALEAFAESEPGYYDLILMDIKMPVMDGLEAAGRIRALNRPDSRTVPIIALSANAYQEDMEKSMAAGMQAHLAKPIEIEEIKKVLKEYILRGIIS